MKEKIDRIITLDNGNMAIEIKGRLIRNFGNSFLLLNEAYQITYIFSTIEEVIAHINLGKS